MDTRSILLGAAMILCMTHEGLTWGDDGHKTVALIAQQCLTPAAKQQVTALLATDTDNLTRHDIASEATWADKFRQHHPETAQWHFVDVEIDRPDLNTACFGRDPLPEGTVASQGPAQACVVDKIKQFQAELAAPNTDAEERLVALKFLLHFTGDLHQPLHSSDHDDRGGNQVQVIVDGFPHKSKDELHGFWDTQFVDALVAPPAGSSRHKGRKAAPKANPADIADKLLADITPDKAREWTALDTPEKWQDETFKMAKKDAYGEPPLSKDQPQQLDQDYVTQAEADVALQLSRAGIRLADLLNQSLGNQPSDWDGCLGATTTARARTRQH
jgi:hypothetical protein